MAISKRELDIEFMTAALALAKSAEDIGEIPVGAVVVQDNEVVGQGFNRSICNNDPSGHAEIIALRDAGSRLSNYRLGECTLYVTLEPCIMCAGAILHARIKRLVFGADDERFGAAGSQLNLVQSKFLNHQCEVTSGILKTECQSTIQTFFKTRRD